MKDKPLFGVIPYFAGEWSVVFHKEESENSTSTHSLTGYGNFPFDRYPNIPVIDFRNNDKVTESLRANWIVEERSVITDYDRKFNASKIIKAADYLNWLQSIGITVINWPEV